MLHYALLRVTRNDQHRRDYVYLQYGIRLVLQNLSIFVSNDAEFRLFLRDGFLHENKDGVGVEALALGFQEVLSGRADMFITANIEAATLLTKFSNLIEIEVTEPLALTQLRCCCHKMIKQESEKTSPRAANLG